MPRFAANLSLLYPDLPFLDRFEAAARDGFEAVEYLFPYEVPAAELRARLRAHGLQQVLFNVPAGGEDPAQCMAAWAAGSRGTACVPGREAEFRAGLRAALAYAEALACPRIHCLVGLRDAASAPEAADATLLANLRWAAGEARGLGVDLLIEPINPRSVPGFHLQRQDHAHRLVQALGEPGVKVQMDLFHCEMVEGADGADPAMGPESHLVRKLRQYLPTGRVGHLQIADAPARHEPGTGAIDWASVFAAVDALSAPGAPGRWEGWVGCEYHPADAAPGGTSRGLARWRALRSSAPS